MKYVVFSQKQKHKLTKTVVAAHCAILLGGCATSASTTIHYTDGKPAQFVECRVSASWSDCYAGANTACPKGYDILVQREQTFWANKALTIRCHDQGRGNE